MVIDVAAVTVIDAPPRQGLGAGRCHGRCNRCPAVPLWVNAGGPVETVLTNLGLLDRFQLRDA